MSQKQQKNGATGKPKKLLFVLRGERSWRRIARKIRADSKRLGLKPLVFK